jgi:hypothetical protein
MKEFNSRALIYCAGFVCALIILSQVCIAGNLEPSAPPGSTMKPLDQVEPRIAITSVPYTISSSGSYYFVKNLATTASTAAITVDANNVTIDLCGFTLSGPVTLWRGNYGIYITGQKNVEIRNGTISHFGQNGIYDADGTDHRVIGMRLISNGAAGIYLAGSGHLVKDCSVYSNGQYASLDSPIGIYVSYYSTITGNKLYYNGQDTTLAVYGIQAYNGSTITNNIIACNGSGSTGAVCAIKAGDGCKIAGNTIRDNYGSDNGTGILAGNYTAVSGNIVSSGKGTGISVGSYCNLSGCNSSSNTQRGIATGNNCTITDCVISSNSNDGINSGDHCTVTGNNVTSNGVWGITCTGGYIAKNTVSMNNTSNTAGKGGIYVSSHSQVRENTLEGNTKNNIYINGARSSIEGNVMSGSDYGINFGATGNVYLNNRATANGTNYNPAGSTDGGGNVSF